MYAAFFAAKFSSHHVILSLQSYERYSGSFIIGFLLVNALNGNTTNTTLWLLKVTSETLRDQHHRQYIFSL